MAAKININEEKWQSAMAKVINGGKAASWRKIIRRK